MAKDAGRPRCLALFDRLERRGGIRTPKQLDLVLSLLDDDEKAGRISKPQAKVVRQAVELIRRARALQKLERREKAQGLGLRVLQGGLKGMRPKK